MRPRPALAVLLTVFGTASTGRSLGLVPPDRSVVLADSDFGRWAPAFARLGFRLVARPAPVALIDPHGLARFSRAGAGVEVEPPVSRLAIRSLRAYAATARCRIVVRGEHGFRLADLALLASVGPCFFEIHLAADPSLFAEGLESLRPAEVVWETGTAVPGLDDLAQLAALPHPFLAVTAGAVARAAAALQALGDDRLGLWARLEKGSMPEAGWTALERAGRAFPVVVEVDGALPADLARSLARLDRLSVELRLGSGHRPPDLRAAALLGRPMAPLRTKKSEKDLDWPLFEAPAPAGAPLKKPERRPISR